MRTEALHSGMAATSKEEAMPTCTSLLDLPVELLKFIMLLVHQDGAEGLMSVLALSSANTLLRNLLQPFVPQELVIRRVERAIKLLKLLANKSAFISFISTKTISLTLESVTSPSPKAAHNCGLGNWIASAHNLVRLLNSLQGLSVLRIKTSTIPKLPRLELGDLLQRRLHVIIDLRSSEALHGKCHKITSWRQSLVHQYSNWIFSFASLHTLAPDLLPLSSRQLAAWSTYEALKWRLNQNDRGTSTVKFLELIKSSHELSELQIFEDSRYYYRDIFTETLSSSECFAGLRRLRLEGRSLVQWALTVVRNLKRLQKLSLYSSFRAAFHYGCLEDLEDESLREMPWLDLPELEVLDLRYICKHSTVQQLIPQGLKALRIEFWAVDESFSVEDIEWIGQACDQLETLEFDIGPINPDSGIPQDTIRKMEALRNFKALRTLRLYPTYWSDGSLMKRPFPNMFRLVEMFKLLKSICPTLQVLHISISLGEFPLEIIGRVSTELAPTKFKVYQNGRDLIIRWREAATSILNEQRWVNGTEPGPATVVNEVDESFFASLDTGWVFSHNDLEDREV